MTKGLAIAVAAICLLVGWLFSRPVVERIDEEGLWNRATPRQVQDALNFKDPTHQYECEKGTAGWQYICYGVQNMPDGTTQRAKYGAMGQPAGAMVTLTELPLDAPTPSRHEHVNRLREERLKQQQRAALLDLNRARIDQLAALPGVSPELARRIANAAVEKPFATVDDLRRVPGVNPELLEQIRPLVRADSLAATSVSASPPRRTGTPAGAIRTKRGRARDEPARAESGAFDDYHISVGTELAGLLRTALGSATSRVGDPVRATLREPVVRGGLDVLPAGSVMHGKVVTVTRASSGVPRGRIAMAFYVIQHGRTGSRASLRTQAVVFEAPAGDLARSARDVVLHGGEPLALVLTRPLTVRIPK